MYKENLRLLNKVRGQIRNARAALMASTEELEHIVGDKYGSREKGFTFSLAHESLGKSDITDQMDRAVDAVLGPMELPDEYFRNLPMLRENYEFSDDPEAFSGELTTVLLYLKIMDGKEDPRMDFCLMRVLFHAGRVLERLEHEGKQRSDKPAKAGGSPSKGYVKDQVYFELFHSEAKGTSKHAICEDVYRLAKEHESSRAEARKTKPRKTKSVRSIGRILKEDLDKLFP